MNSPSAYPEQITAALVTRSQELGLESDKLPCAGALTQLIDVVYQTSLLQEEGEALQVRAVFATAEELASETKDLNAAWHVVLFNEVMPFTVQDLRKLTPAVGYYRSMLGVCGNADEPRIWGIVVTGTQWVNRHVSIPHAASHLPHHLIFHALAPGHLMITHGAERLVEVFGGKLLTEGFDPFLSQWLPQRFANIRAGVIADLALGNSPETASKVDQNFVRHAAQSVIRRVLRLVRARRHGGMLIYLPEDSVCHDWLPHWLRFRVRFQQDETSCRFRTLLLSLLQRAVAVAQEQGLHQVTWADYLRLHDSKLAEIESAMTDFASFLADLMGIDGALVLNQRFQLIGFGAEILGDSHVATIARALDLEATEVQLEPADSAGTRHRSAYRLVSAQPAVIAVVVSQDGEARFVANHRDRLTYWPYLP